MTSSDVPATPAGDRRDDDASRDGGVGAGDVQAWAEALAAQLRSPISVEDLTRLLEELLAASEAQAVPESEVLALLDDLWEHFKHVELPSTGRPALDIVARAWLSSAYRQARAAGVLTRLGMVDAAVANARVAFEHGIYLSLIADTRDHAAVLDALEDRFIRVWNTLLASFPGAEALLPLLANISAELDVPAQMAWVRNVQQVCQKLESGDVLYAVYRMLTGEMHPGVGSALPYVISSVESGGTANEPASFIAHKALEVAVGACVWAGWSTDALFSVELFSPVVARAAERLQYIPLTRLVD